MSAHLIGVTVGKRPLPKSKDDSTPVDTMTLNLRYKGNVGGREISGSAERWVQVGESSKLASLDNEMQIIAKYTGKPVSYRDPAGLKLLVKLTETELAKVPVELRIDSRDGKEYLTILDVAQNDEDIDAMFGATVGASGAARSGSNSGRQRPQG